MMEQCMRIIDYSLNYIANLFNTGQANADFAPVEESDIEEEPSELGSEAPHRQPENNMLGESVAQSELVSIDLDSDDEKPRNFWE